MLREAEDRGSLQERADGRHHGYGRGHQAGDLAPQVIMCSCINIVYNMFKYMMINSRDHFLSEVILALLPPSCLEGGMYLGRLPRTK